MEPKWEKCVAFISLPHQNPTAVIVEIKIDNVFKLCWEQIILRSFIKPPQHESSKSTLFWNPLADDATKFKDKCNAYRQVLEYTESWDRR